MNTIEKLRSMLAKYPELSYEYDDHRLAIPAANSEGFHVSIFISSQSYTVHFEGWHEEFDNEEEALNCFAFGLSNSCRLKVHYKGEYPYKWVVEFLENDTWRKDSETSLLFYPFWRKSQVRYLQNHLKQD